MAPLSKGF
jgi:hypothetical protein